MTTVDNARRKKHPGCTSCSRQASSRAQQLTDDEAVSRALAAGAQPLEPYPGSALKKWRMRCLTCGEICSPRLNALSTQGPCSACGLRRSSEGRRKFADRATLPGGPASASEAAKAANFEPLEPYPGRTDRPWRCRCLVCGQASKPRLSTMLMGHACGACGTVRSAELRRLSDQEARSRLEAAGATPLEPYPGSTNSPWRARCNSCEKEISPRLGGLSKQGACVYCAGKKVDVGEAYDVARLRGVKPLGDFEGSHQRWLVQCEACDHTWFSTYKRLSGGHGCPQCADHGFKPGEPALIYLIRQERLGVLKIGITSVDSNRLSHHERHGWTVVATKSFSNGSEAEERENSVLSYWREDCGAGPALSKWEMRQGGHTETVLEASVDLRATLDLALGDS